MEQVENNIKRRRHSSSFIESDNIGTATVSGEEQSKKRDASSLTQSLSSHHLCQQTLERQMKESLLEEVKSLLSSFLC